MQKIAAETHSVFALCRKRTEQPVGKRDHKTIELLCDETYEHRRGKRSLAHPRKFMQKDKGKQDGNDDERTVHADLDVTEAGAYKKAIKKRFPNKEVRETHKKFAR